MQLGKAIKLCREQKGFSRSEFSEKTSLSVSYLSLLENDKRDPSFSKVEKIAEALGIPLSVLLFLAADRSELETINPELAEKLSLLTLKLIQKTTNGSHSIST